MDHLIGQRFSLISKSEIRYVGTLHEINPEQSTISLEDVFSYGTEDRSPDNFIPPSQQKFDYIVFRGSDVKDIKVAEEQKENQQPSPPPVPNDPAILNSSRPGPPQGRPQDTRAPLAFPPPGYPPQPQFDQYPPNQYGRGFGPPPAAFGGPGPQFYPPPGYYGGPPGPPGPPGPGGPFPQGSRPYPPPPSMGPPGHRVHDSPRQQPSLPKQTSELPDNKAPSSKPVATPAKVESTPVVPGVPQLKSEAPEAKKTRVAPAVPFTVNQKSFTPPVASDGLLAPTNGNTSSTPNPSTQASLEDASRQAKAAVAEAMAKLNPQSAQAKSVPSAEAIDALSKKVNELSTGKQQAPRGRGAYRGGRGNRSTSGGQKKIDIPQSDYDFESANAKFSKEDLIKEAIAAGSPVAETADAPLADVEEPVPERKDSVTAAAPAYNKSTSFFDNISSEAREREEGGDGRAHARALRGQEFKKNIETFGQGNVEGGYRGGYRGRGRGRGYGRGSNRGFGRGRGRGGAEAAAN